MERTQKPELTTVAPLVEAYANADLDKEHAEHAREIRQQFAHKPPLRVLDLACGSVEVTCQVAKDFPRAVFTAVDSSRPMLDQAHKSAEKAGLEGRFVFVKEALPGLSLDVNSFDAVLCTNSLHDFQDPRNLWETVGLYGVTGTQVFVLDLRRPPDEETLQRLVAEQGDDVDPILRDDLEASLRSAYTVEEVESQLAVTGLGNLEVREKDALHLIVQGTLR